MRALIDRIIVEYVNMSKRYRYGFSSVEEKMLEDLDWDVLLICVFLSLPDDYFSDNCNLEDTFEEMEFILKYCNVEFQSASDEGKGGKIKIKGYMLSDVTEHVPCFYMLCLLIYCHIIKNKDEKKEFLHCMVISSAHNRIRRFSEENRNFILERYPLLQTYYDADYEKIDPNSGRKKFDNFLRKFHMNGDFSGENMMDYMKIRDMATIGFALMKQ